MGNGSWHGCTLWDGRGWLTDTQRVIVKESPKNSQKFINEMGAALELAKDDIAWLFNERKFEELKQLVKDVALYGYTATIEERMKSIKNEAMVTAQVEAGRKAEPQVVVKQVDVMGLMGALSTKGEARLSDFATPVEVNDNQDDNANENQNNSNNMEVNNMKAADLIGKTIIVGENIATITIKSADGDKLQGEFKKAGSTLGMQLPITMENLRQQIESGAWKLQTHPQTPPVMEGSSLSPDPSPKGEGSDEGEFADYEEVTEESEEESLHSRGDLEGSEDPVLKQWRAAKAKHSDAVIIFRNGNVYVVIAEDAEKVAKVAGLQCGKHGDTAISVFPVAELSVVLPKIIGAGMRTAIVDLIVEPKAQPEPEKPMTATQRIVVARVPRPDEKADEPKPKARVQPKAVIVEEPAEPETTPAEDVVVTAEPETTERVQPKRASECTLEAKKCTPYIIDQGGACIYVGGNTEKLEGVLYLMWGRKRAYQEGNDKYSGVQVSRKHKKMLEEILKIAC